jgi:hypothetical protein
MVGEGDVSDRKKVSKRRSDCVISRKNFRDGVPEHSVAFRSKNAPGFTSPDPLFSRIIYMHYVKLYSHEM